MMMEITIIKESRRKTIMKIHSNGKEYYSQFENLREATEYCHDILDCYNYTVYNFTNMNKETKTGYKKILLQRSSKLKLQKERAEA